MNELKPIGTAPKNGEWVVLFGRGNSRYYFGIECCVGRYDYDNDCWESIMGDPIDETILPLGPVCWCELPDINI